MNEISVLMALVDSVPIICFSVAAVILMRESYNKMTQLQYTMLSGGSLVIIGGGIYKILWKILYALKVCDYPTLDEAFFPMQALGFMLMGIALLMMLKSNKVKGEAAINKNASETTAAVGVPVVTSHLPFILIVFVGMMLTEIALGMIAFKMKHKKIAIAFAVSFVILSVESRVGAIFDDTPGMHWVAQFVNILGEGLLMVGVIALSRCGYGKADALKCDR